MSNNLNGRILIAFGQLGDYLTRASSLTVCRTHGIPSPLPAPTIDDGVKALEALGELSDIVAQLLQEKGQRHVRDPEIVQLIRENDLNYQPPETD